MRIAITGGTGLVGRFIVEGAHGHGHAVTLLGRSVPPDPFRHQAWRLGEEARLDGQDALVHAAFDHLPGRYRGGEGDDPAGYVRRNLEGTLRLFRDARSAGVSRVVFLSSRAVYGRHPPGMSLAEGTALRPDTLYGEVKRDAEAALAAFSGGGLVGISLRATGIYGPAEPERRHKWQDLFDDFRAGRVIAPRAGTEVHGDDLWSAVSLALHAPFDALPFALNVSDIVVDRRALLAEVAALTGWTGRLPDAADVGRLNVMETHRLRALGWRPGGWERLRATLPALVATGASGASASGPAPPPGR